MHVTARALVLLQAAGLRAEAWLHSEKGIPTKKVVHRGRACHTQAIACMSALQGMCPHTYQGLVHSRAPAADRPPRLLPEAGWLRGSTTGRPSACGVCYKVSQGGYLIGVAVTEDMEQH